MFRWSCVHTFMFIWSYDRLLIRSYDHMTMWWCGPCDHMITSSYGHIIIDHIIVWSSKHMTIYGHLIRWAYDHVIIWSYGRMIIRSYGHMTIWSYDHMVTSYDRMIIWSNDHMTIWSYSHLSILSTWSYGHMMHSCDFFMSGHGQGTGNIID